MRSEIDAKQETPLSKVLAPSEAESSPDVRGDLPQGRGPSQADRLVEIGRAAELFHDRNRSPFARVEVGGHLEIWPVRSKQFRNWLRLTLYQESGKTPGNDGVNAALGVLEGLATFRGSEHALHNRVARLDSDLYYYDLTDNEWRAVRVGRSGWEIVERPPILFRRYAHQREQVVPARGGDVFKVLNFLNVRQEDALLLVVWLVASFIPDIPHPIPDFHGEKGAGKTVGQRVLRRLIDPSQIESLAFPTEVRDLVQQLSHHYAPIYDNIDNLPPWTSDVLCRAVTGEGFSKRELYSDDDDVIYSYRRVIMLNGVNVVARRPDLLDRTVLIGLERISRGDRRAESEFWNQFDEERPAILGGVFDTLVKAICIYPKLRLREMERMADFTRWGAAIAEAVGSGADAFLCAYASNIGVQTREAVEGHIVGSAILALMSDKPEWSGTPTELLPALEQAGEQARLFKRTATGKVDARGWPGGPQILGRRLNEVRSNLLDLGYQITQDSDGQRIVTISRVSHQGGENSVSSVSSDGADATDAEIATSEGERWEAVIR
jgi:hypothetical protein